MGSVNKTQHPSDWIAATRQAQQEQAARLQQAQAAPKAKVESEPPPFIAKPKARLRNPVQGTLFETWPEIYSSQAICSHALFRSAIFSCRPANSLREQYTNQVISSTSQYVITRSGYDLRQDDANVLMYLIQAAAEQKTFSPRIVIYQVLTKVGLAGSGEDYNRFLECLDRLYGTSLKIKMLSKAVAHKEKSVVGEFEGHLLATKAWIGSDEETTPGRIEWVIQIDPRLAQLFPINGWSYARWEHRASLRRKPLASWLHLFLSTSQKPIAMSVAKYHELSGSVNKEVRFFKSALLKACEELKLIGFLKSYHVTPSNLLEVERCSTPKTLNQ